MENSGFVTVKHVTVQYAAWMRESANTSEELVETTADTTAQFFIEICRRHGFPISCGAVQVFIDGVQQSMKTELRDGMTLFFVPPLPGG